ncbi:hypothetical protein Tco_0874548 [Tanacetum coccineum]|uniref:Uncharacterized protein n=1 Tax=Tanacetum coccineum TaxID=301880 RepID=A0ABQ5BPS4_9ASTR
MPKYAKNLKGLLSNKAWLEEACTLTMNEIFFMVLLNKLPSKEKDPGSFTIPSDIGHLHINNALADLGASISLMPYAMPFLATARAMIDAFNKKITLRVGNEENYDTSNAGNIQNNQKHEERMDDPSHEPSVCKIRRFEMMKYSFNANKEYIAIKESKYLNHSKDNLDAYRELLRIIGKGWVMATPDNE